MRETPGSPPDEPEALEATARVGAPKAVRVAAAPEPAATALPPGTQVGRYVLDHPLGAGGMGVVYAARDPELDRAVALKLLRPELGEGERGTEGRNRLFREAQAMAKLNHPNVVAIYDSGNYGDQVFLAVELVEGTTLKAWLAEKPRTWREVLDVFLAAGRGLSAAHAAGLVHRDFKPANVLIGNRGEVKVADFGLARRAGGERRPGLLTIDAAAAAEISSDSLLAAPLTRHGAVSGTPAYMAPEQLLGEATDARTDEFSFCVALYRSLYGEPPFEATLDPGGLNRVRPAPKGSRVPQWVRRPLLRGLATKPEDRFATLAELLEALSRDPAERRRAVATRAALAALSLAAVAGTFLFFEHQREAQDPCHAPGRKIAAIWSPAVRAQLRAAFAATGGADAATSATYAEKALDRAGAAWLSAYQGACRATREQHTQSETALALRLDCLDEQLLDHRAAVELLLHPGVKGLSSVLGAAIRLPLPLECADAKTLSAIDQPPAELRESIQAMRLRIARARGLFNTAQFDEAVAALEPLPEEAHALGAPSLEAKSLAILAGAYGNAAAPDPYRKAAEGFKRAAAIAQAARLDGAAAESFSSAGDYLALQGAPRAEVQAVLEQAKAELLRVGLGGPAEYDYESAMQVANRYDPVAATPHGRRALELAEQLYGPESFQFALQLNNFEGDCIDPLGKYEEGVGYLRRSAAASDALLGPNNQRALLPLYNLAGTLVHLGRFDEAKQTLGDLFRRADPSADNAWVSLALGVQADLLAATGERDPSLDAARRGIEMADRMHLLGSDNFIDLHQLVAEAYLQDKEAARAVEEYETFLSRQDLPPENPGWVLSLRLGGWAYLATDQPKKALPVLERALRLSAAHPFFPGWVARLRYQIAQALVETHGDRKRAEALARTAHDDLVGEPVTKELLAEVDAWREKTFGRVGRR